MPIIIKREISQWIYKNDYGCQKKTATQKKNDLFVFYFFQLILLLSLMTKTPQNIFLKIWSILTLIYIISISFQTILTLPVVDRKIQPPEIIFLMTIIFLLFNLRKISFSKFRWNKLDIGLVIYLGVILITTFFAKNIRPYIELLGLFYLFSSYLMIRLFLISINSFNSVYKVSSFSTNFCLT